MTRTQLMLLAAAGSLSVGAAIAEPLEIGLLTPSPLADVGWSHALAAGLDGIKAKHGDKVKINIIENIQEGPDADRIPFAP